jgi:hypothetical protein
MQTLHDATISTRTSLLRDLCVRVPETGRDGEPMHAMVPENGPVLVVDDGPNTAIVAPELIARVRASLRAMKIRQMRRSSLTGA